MPVERRLRRVEEYLQNHLYPMMVDIDESVSRMEDKYTKLLKLLEKNLNK